MPKEIKKKQSNIREMRTRGSRGPKTGSRTPVKGMNRQMRRKLQNQGIEGMEPIEATRVIIQTEEGDLVIEEPQVIKVEQQGVEMYQVIGETTEMAPGEIQIGNSELLSDDDFEEEEIEEEELKVEITPQDIMLVASQTGVSEEAAENALKNANGDLAKAIMNLKTM